MDIGYVSSLVFAVLGVWWPRALHGPAKTVTPSRTPAPLLAFAHETGTTVNTFSAIPLTMCLHWCVCVDTYSTLVKVRGQFGGAADSLFFYVASRPRTQVIKLSGKYSYLPGHLSNPLGISFCTWRVLYWYKMDSQGGRMTQQVKVLAMKAKISVLNSWNHRRMEGENPLLRSCPLTFPHRLSQCTPICLTHTHKQ